MTKKKTDPELTKIIEKAKAKATKTDAEVDAWEKRLRGYSEIKKTTQEIKSFVGKQSPEAPVQQIFGFLPTRMTRISPFFPLSRREMKDRPVEKLTWETSWGKLTVSGERLSIYDESVLLAVLLLMRKNQAETFQTTRYEICQIMNVKPCTETYTAIWEALKRLTKTGIDLEVWEGKKKKKRKAKIEMTTTILSGAIHTERFQITVNPYFFEMYAKGFLTNLDLKFRANLMGDITKALYRFYEGQRDTCYQCHLLTLAKAVNLNVKMDTFRLRSRIRTGLRELRKKRYLKRWTLSKSDIVTAWKAKDKLLSN